MARGKYADVIDQLPRMLGSEPEYQQKVEAVKSAISVDPDWEMHASFLAKEYASLRAEKQAAEDALSEINLRLEAVSQLMAEQFEVEGVTSLKAHGKAISIYLEPYARVADSEVFRQWCLADADLARRMTLPWQTTNALTKSRLLAGEPEPPGVTCYAKTRIRMGSE